MKRNEELVKTLAKVLAARTLKYLGKYCLGVPGFTLQKSITLQIIECNAVTLFKRVLDEKRFTHFYHKNALRSYQKLF